MSDKCRDGTFNIGLGRHLNASLPLLYPGLSFRYLNAINNIQVENRGQGRIKGGTKEAAAHVPPPLFQGPHQIAQEGK